MMAFNYCNIWNYYKNQAEIDYDRNFEHENIYDSHKIEEAIKWVNLLNKPFLLEKLIPELINKNWVKNKINNNLF
jgi:hypothetical protein